MTTLLAPEYPQPGHLALLYDVPEDLLLQPVHQLRVAHQLHGTRQSQRGATHHCLEDLLQFGIFEYVLANLVSNSFAALSLSHSLKA